MEENKYLKFADYIPDDLEIRLKNIKFYYDYDGIHLGLDRGFYFYDILDKTCYELVQGVVFTANKFDIKDSFVLKDILSIPLNIIDIMYSETEELFYNLVKQDFEKVRYYDSKKGKALYKQLQKYLDPIKESYTIKEYRDFNKIYNQCASIVTNAEKEYVVVL